MSKSLSFSRLGCFFLFLLPVLGQAQTTKLKPAGKLSATAAAQIHQIEDTLGILVYAVVNDSVETERFAACRALIPALVRALKVENSFRYPFERLSGLSILAPPDSSFRIITWQLFVNDSTYRYYGAIQRNSQELVIFPLRDKRSELDYRPVHDQLTPENWYGALYYNLRQFDTKEGRKYLLFGYDAFTFFEKRKVIDVLSFDKTGQVVFGAPVFDRTNPPPGPPEQRLLFEYSAETSVRVNWDEVYQMVLFDHLIPFPSPFGRGITQVVDGSYDGLKLEKGRWKYIDQVFHDAQETPPFPNPVLDNRKGRDIMGREKKVKVVGAKNRP
ncbi:MAG: hypothetical protein ABIO24_11280 [Saprospiraceae bacterium]